MKSSVATAAAPAAVSAAKQRQPSARPAPLKPVSERPHYEKLASFKKEWTMTRAPRTLPPQSPQQKILLLDVDETMWDFNNRAFIFPCLFGTLIQMAKQLGYIVGIATLRKHEVSEKDKTADYSIESIIDTLGGNELFDWICFTNQASKVDFLHFIHEYYFAKAPDKKNNICLIDDLQHIFVSAHIQGFFAIQANKTDKNSLQPVRTFLFGNDDADMKFLRLFSDILSHSLEIQTKRIQEKQGVNEEDIFNGEELYNYIDQVCFSEIEILFVINKIYSCLNENIKNYFVLLFSEKPEVIKILICQENNNILNDIVKSFPEKVYACINDSILGYGPLRASSGFLKQLLIKATLDKKTGSENSTYQNEKIHDLFVRSVEHRQYDFVKAILKMPITLTEKEIDLMEKSNHKKLKRFAIHYHLSAYIRYEKSKLEKKVGDKKVTEAKMSAARYFQKFINDVNKSKTHLKIPEDIASCVTTSKKLSQFYRSLESLQSKESAKKLKLARR